MANPGRYLTLLPPINGADSITGSAYFTQNPGDPYKAWDASLTFDWMPKQYIPFRAEYGYRHAKRRDQSSIRIPMPTPPITPWSGYDR